MKPSLLKIFILVVSASTYTSQATDITLTTKDNFELKTSFYQAKTTDNRAVLLLHQCNYNRTMYNNIGQQLANKGIHALSLDFRGFGESINDKFDVKKVQKLPENKRRSAWQKMATNWPSDVQQAHDFLKNKLTGGIVGVIGASCGGGQAITLAEANPVTAISFFSSGQNEENINRYKASLANKPTFIIAAEDDTFTYNSAKQLFTETKNINSKLVAYKGSDHGFPLLDKDTQLANSLVNWFDKQLTHK